MSSVLLKKQTKDTKEEQERHNGAMFLLLGFGILVLVVGGLMNTLSHYKGRAWHH